jgi:CDP-glucose 4,6-dehydratase
VLEPLYGYLLLGSALSGPEGKAFCGPWNFGPYPSNAVTVEDLVKEIISQWGSGMYHIKESQPKNKESNMLVLDINKAVHLLNWNPVLPLKKSMQLTVNEYRIGGLSEDVVFNQRLDHIDEYMNIQRSMV